jgi:N-methylhydantoinase B/oxoprolinase/acetone carboxylase alpha subunit
MTASIHSNGRRRGAFGAAGGEPGRPGVNRVERRDGRVEQLDHIGSVEMEPGDVFVIETPGGGGYGPPPADAAAVPADATSPPRTPSDRACLRIRARRACVDEPPTPASC